MLKSFYYSDGPNQDTGLNNITLKGILEPAQDSADLAKVSTLFTNYINGDVSTVIATGQSTLQNDGSVIQWLSDGLQVLRLQAPFKSFIPINPIPAIDIGNMELIFSPETPWTPRVASSSVRASLSTFSSRLGPLPELTIFDSATLRIQPFRWPNSERLRDRSKWAICRRPLYSELFNFFITKRVSHIIWSTSLLVPPRPPYVFLGRLILRELSTLSSQTRTSRVLTPNALHLLLLVSYCLVQVYGQLIPSYPDANLTSSDIAEFRLIGNSSATANLSIGQITLNPIKVNVSTQLFGLQGLKGMTHIEGVDVVGGTADHINLNINGNYLHSFLREN